MASKLRPSPDHAGPPPSQPYADLDQKITNEQVGRDQNQKPVCCCKVHYHESPSSGFLYMKTVCEDFGNLLFTVPERGEVSENEGSSLLYNHHKPGIEPGSEGSGFKTNDHASGEKNHQNVGDGVRIENEVNGNYGSYQQPVRPDGDGGGMLMLGTLPCKLNHPPKERNQAAKDKVKEREEENSKRSVKTECKGAKGKVKEREQNPERSEKTECKVAKEREQNVEKSAKTECKGAKEKVKDREQNLEKSAKAECKGAKEKVNEREQNSERSGKTECKGAKEKVKDREQNLEKSAKTECKGAKEKVKESEQNPERSGKTECKVTKEKVKEREQNLEKSAKTECKGAKEKVKERELNPERSGRTECKGAKEKANEREQNSERSGKTECKGAKEKVKEREQNPERSGKTECKGAKVNVKEKEENPKRLWKAECKNYMLPGGCKYGNACRFKHGNNRSPVSQIVDSNFLGLPIRPGQKECPLYMSTGSCKYGSNCKFHHPDPCAVEVGDSGSGSGSYQDASSQSNLFSWSPTAMNDNNPSATEVGDSGFGNGASGSGSGSGSYQGAPSQSNLLSWSPTEMNENNPSAAEVGDSGFGNGASGSYQGASSQSNLLFWSPTAMNDNNPSAAEVGDYGFGNGASGSGSYQDASSQSNLSPTAMNDNNPSAAEVGDSGFGNGASGSVSYREASSQSNLLSSSPPAMNDNNQFGPTMFPSTQEVSPEPEWNAYQVQTIRRAYNELGANRSCTDILQIQMVLNRVYKMLGHVLSSTEEVAALTNDQPPAEPAAVVQVPVVQPRRKQRQRQQQQQRVGTRLLDEDDTSTSQQLQQQQSLAPDSPIHAATSTTIQAAPSPLPSVTVPSISCHPLQHSLSSGTEFITAASTHHLCPSPTPNATPIQHTLRPKKVVAATSPPASSLGKHPQVEPKTNSGESMDGLTCTGLSNEEPTTPEMQKNVEDPMDLSTIGQDGALGRSRAKRRAAKKRVKVPAPVENPVAGGFPTSDAVEDRSCAGIGFLV